MKVFDRRRLKAAIRSHTDAGNALSSWYEIVKRSDWKSFNDARREFNSASYVDPFVVFNIKGNDYRLVTYVDFERQWVVMKWFGSHAEYDTGAWK